MKKTLKILGLLLISAALVTCEALEKADDVTFHADLEIVFAADENADGINVLYPFEAELLDIADNSEIQEYIDKIKDIEITNITYRITGYTESDPACTGVIMTNGTASFEPFVTGSIVSGNFAAGAAGVNLQTTTAETDLDFSADQFNDIADMLLEDKKVWMYADGTLSCTPIAFNVVAKFYVTVTADALK